MGTFFVDNSLQGAGDHSTAGNAGQFNLVWAKLSAADIVEVADGTAGDGAYEGINNMVAPTRINGSSGSPIIVRATNDGKPLIDGESTRNAFTVAGCTWMEFEGMKFRNGKTNQSLLYITSDTPSFPSSNIKVKRTTGWDSSLSGNTHIFGAANISDTILWEDCAGWGVGRKIYEAHRCQRVTWRRCFGVWMGSTRSGPKATFNPAYRSYNSLLENCIAMWTGEAQGANPSPDQTHGLYSATQVRDDDLDVVDGGADPLDAFTRFYGCMGILRIGDLHVSGSDDKGGLFLGARGGTDERDVKDYVSIIEEGAFPTKFGIHLRWFSGDPPGDALTADGLTAIGGGGIKVGSQWTALDQDAGATYADVSSIFSSATGAQVCKRYVDGTLTAVELFPWPMQQRILDDMAESGYNVINLEGELQRLTETIPAACKNPPPEPPPANPKQKWIGGGQSSYPGL